MDKVVEELQQELKLLKNEIKETLTDVREVLLNTVENPFPHETAASAALLPPPPAAPAPAPLPQAETPPVAAPPPVAPPPAPVQQAPQMPSPPPGAMGGYPMGGAPIILGNMGAGGATPPGASAAEMQATMQAMQAMQAKMANTADTASVEDMQAMQATMQAMQANVAKLGAGSAEAAPPIETLAPAAGPGLPPKSRSAAGPVGKPSAGNRRPGGPSLPSRRGGTTNRRHDGAEKQAEDEERQPPAKTSGRPSLGGPADATGRRRKPRGRRQDEDEQYLDEAYDDGDEDEYGEGEYDDDQDRYRQGDDRSRDERRQPSRRTGKVDLVVLASLAPWLSEGVYQFGRKRVKSLLAVYASMGGIPTEMKDVLLQIVSLDDTEGPEKPVAIHDTMRFLIELDDLMWRGRQDWRRAALMSMIGTNKLASELETE